MEAVYIAHLQSQCPDRDLGADPVTLGCLGVKAARWPPMHRRASSRLMHIAYIYVCVTLRMADLSDTTADI